MLYKEIKMDQRAFIKLLEENMGKSLMILVLATVCWFVGCDTKSMTTREKVNWTTKELNCKNTSSYGIGENTYKPYLIRGENLEYTKNPYKSTTKTLLKIDSPKIHKWPVSK